MTPNCSLGRASPKSEAYFSDKYVVYVGNDDNPKQLPQLSEIPLAMQL